MHTGKMSALEQRAVVSLSSIMGLRMIGLFMVIPVFSLYAQQLESATPILIGLAMGIYGLSQALFQIPFGMLSDRIGRKPIIVMGLFIFAMGSLMAAMAHSITVMNVGFTYRVRPDATVFLNVNNITEQGQERYTGYANRHRTSWIVPRSVKFGVTGQF